MQNEKISRKAVLEMIKNGEVTPEEGYQLLLKKKNTVNEYAKQAMDIAIIGMSGRFPGADNLEEFWENLTHGVDSVTEIPKDRWDVEAYYSNELGKQGKTNCKYGAMLKDIDKFDPLFFNISPKEAESMDPQQRLFLMESWKAIEDAGYNPAKMEEQKCGVFAGVSKGDYDHQILKSENLDAQLLTGMQTSILPARVSYYMNFVGPSVSIDTACSSSLVAVHMASQSILNGECEIALAGGVCVLTSPELFIMASAGGMLSVDGKCKAFDDDANGFVPGEGVGVILLKPLQKAIKDNDHIYGVIKGSMTNQDGKTNGITAPSVQSQVNLETEVYERYGINPDDIGYVEAHGTGTKLGDPIEWNALTKVFGNYTDRKGYCVIGSVKTNIGHGITSAGIAALIKTMLCLKKKELVPSLHFHKANGYLHLEESPFYVNTELKKWEVARGTKRTAAISSFGLSGTNCHMVIEEAPDASEINESCQSLYLIPISAKTEDALLRMAKQLLKWAASNEHFQMGDLAYTLSVGRSHFSYRLALLVSDREELIRKLNAYLNNDSVDNSTYIGILGTTKLEKTEVIKAQASWEALCAAEDNDRIRRNQMVICADYYVQGFLPNWSELYGHGSYSHIAVPTYSFEKERYWIETDEPHNNSNWLHPLIEKNISTLKEQAYSSLFDGQEFFLKEHIVAKKKVLPAVVYIEIARAAGELAGKDKVFTIQDITWFQAIQVGDKGVKLKILLLPVKDQVHFEIKTEESDGIQTLHCKGKLLYEGKNDTKQKLTMDLTPFHNTDFEENNAEEIYQTYQMMGIDFGRKFHSIHHIQYGAQECYSVIDCSEDSMEAKEYGLYPAMLDGALQSVIGLKNDQEETKAFLPFSMEQISIYGRLPEKCFVHITKNDSALVDEKRFHIEIADTSGKILVRIKNYCVKELHGVKIPNENAIVTFQSNWSEKGKIEMFEKQESVSTIIVFGQDDESFESFKNQYGQMNVILVTSGNKYKQINEKHYEIESSSEQDIRKLISKLQERYHVIDAVIYLWNRECVRESIDNLEQQLEKSLYPTFYIYKELLQDRSGNHKTLLFVYQSEKEHLQCINSAMGAFAKTIQYENPNLTCKTINIQDNWNSETLVNIVSQELMKETANDTIVCYQQGKRFVKTYNEVTLKHSEKLIWKENGVYLITGGAGGLGLIFANYITSKVRTNIILVGRSTLSESAIVKIQDMEKTGSKVRYLQADITNWQETKELISTIQSNYSYINGIIHSAGVIEDDYVIHKSMASLQKVIKPKVFGSMYLDEATKQIPLDFFVMFSSTAAVYGNPGQCDYAFANDFMNHFAAQREKWQQKGLHSGRTLTIDWPLWKDGNMTVDEESKKELERKTGMIPLSTANGIHVFEDAISSNLTNVSVIEGKVEIIKQSFNGLGIVRAKKDNGQVLNTIVNTENEKDKIYKRSENVLRKVISDITKLPESKIKEEEDFDIYGIDSVMVVAGNRELEKYFGEISKTLFFEYRNLKDLATYFAEHYALNFVKEDETKVDDIVKELEQIEVERFLLQKNLNIEAEKQEEKQEENIAIIGLSGKYPMADDVCEFWSNLKQGKDCITEIPKDRWDYDKFYSEDKDKNGICLSKWGGFINDFDKFDAIFFRISPKDAEIMDPQERLFLENSWKVIEDAGYRIDNLGTNQVGVFVGAMYGQYQMYGAEETVKGTPIALNSSFSSIANRVSYTFDFHGPSICIDTMCSSSLTSIHLACESIKNGECDLAIAGGVNLSIHPSKYQLLSQGKFLAEDGRCRTFGEGGTGYVPGEGVGAVLLKPLKKAIADGDHIYGTILGSSINHGGKTNGYTVPNPNAQAEVIRKTLKKANVNPRNVGYVEAHGTGTALGDPIEITGLMKAFREYTQDKQFCAIGSVKSNIGHLESAAGIGGLTKVLLQMKYKKLVPSIHSEVLNSNINFGETPFYVQKNFSDWNPTSRQDVNKRIAAISAFGAGGSNAHIILEEYEEQPLIEQEENGNVFILSAKKEDRLKEYASHFLSFLKYNHENGVSLNMENIAYTLQMGRESMKYKLAIVVSSVQELESKLEEFCSGKITDRNIFVGMQKEGDETLLQDGSRNLSNLRRFAQDWISDKLVDWNILYNGMINKPTKVSLPTYPFQGKRYWFDSYHSSDKQVQKEIETILEPTKKQIEETIQVQSDKDIILAELDEKARKYCGDEVVLKIIDDTIALVTMQDRVNRNMFSENIISGLMSTFERINQNNQIKVVVITGYENIFSMGGTQDQLLHIANRNNNFTDVPFMYTGLLKCEVPVISAMQGHAVGGGMLFGLYADIVIMAEEAVYGSVFTKYGFTPGMGATFILPEKLGKNIAIEMMYTAKNFRGEELKDRGATVLFRKSKDVLPEAMSIARMLSEKPRYTLQVLKNDLSSRILSQLPIILDREVKMHEKTFGNLDTKQRINRYYHTKDEHDAKNNGKMENSVNDEIMEHILTELENGEIDSQQAMENLNMQTDVKSDLEKLSLEQLLDGLESGNIGLEQAADYKL